MVDYLLSVSQLVTQTISDSVKMRQPDSAVVAFTKAVLLEKEKSSLRQCANCLGFFFLLVPSSVHEGGQLFFRSAYLAVAN